MKISQLVYSDDHSIILKPEKFNPAGEFKTRPFTGSYHLEEWL